MIHFIKDKLSGKVPRGTSRSGSWRTVRALFLEHFPNCAVCGSTDKVEVHHMMPFHLDQTKELDVKNMITLCESWKNGMNCHLLIGHLGNFRSYNPRVTEDARIWAFRLKQRPQPK